MASEGNASGTSASRDGKAQELAAGYATWHRVYELGAITATTSTGLWFCYRLARAPQISGWWVPLAALVGILFADFVSGLFHWIFDTWGAVDTPVFGAVAIRTFRHHHVDQQAITQHDFVETNGHNFGLSITLTGSALVFIDPANASLFGMFMGMALMFATVFVSLTSQIHKWAHTEAPPAMVRALQRVRLIISPEHHAGHHSAPYTRNYCITVGWMNGPLRAMRFFETLERMIALATGAVPREDDLGKDTADLVTREP